MFREPMYIREVRSYMGIMRAIACCMLFSCNVDFLEYTDGSLFSGPCMSDHARARAGVMAWLGYRYRRIQSRGGLAGMSWRRRSGVSDRDDVYYNTLVITQYSSTVYIGIAIVFVFPPYIH